MLVPAKEEETVKTQRTSRTLNTLAFSWLLAIAGAASLANAQPQWTRQSVLPTDRDLNSVAFATPLHGFMVGRNRALFETFDGGRTWIERNLEAHSTNPYYDVFFIDENHGWVTGNNSDALRTTDGGQTWTPMPGMAGSWRFIDFESPTHGIFMANGACAGTTDGGQTWELRLGWPDCPIAWGSDFIDAEIGLVSGHQIPDDLDGIFRTTDGGRTWTHVLDAVINDVMYVDQNTAVATGVLPGQVYRSTDGGQSWAAVSQEFEEDGPLNDLALVDEFTIAGASHQGDVWLSHDLGTTWTKTLDAIGDLPYTWELNFTDAGVGILTGARGIIYRTSDGGQTWQYITNGIGMDITAIEMHTDRYGIAVARNTYVMRTTDGGTHWTVQKPEIRGQEFGFDESLNAVDILDDQNAFIAGPGGTVFKSVDAGQNWMPISSGGRLPVDLDIRDIAARTPDDIWVVGSNRDMFRTQESIYRTLNGGQTWFRPFDGAAFELIQFIGEDKGWIMRLGGILHRTDDGGNTWQDVTLPDVYFGDNPTIQDMQFIDENVGWAVGWWDYAARTLDGGRTWQTFDFGNNHEVRVAMGVAVISANEVWVVGVDRQIQPITLHTVNGGQTWIRSRDSLFPYNPAQLDASPSGDLWAAGWGGRIISTATPCPADLDGDGDIDADDFFAYLDLFATRDPAADIDGDGDIDADDFFGYLDLFAAGC